MKSLLSIILVVFALSLCNLTGKRSNENGNSNSRPSGTSQETNPDSTNQSSPQPQDQRIASGVPPAPIRNSNMAMPGSKTGPATTGPSLSNQSAPPPPPPSPPRPRGPISGGVLNGKAISLPKPAYPAIARAAHASGTVNVQVIIDENGNVMTAHAVSGHPLLQQSAVQAARQARFSPTLLSGQPVKVTGIIVYNFVSQ